MIAVIHKLFQILEVFANEGDPLPLSRLTQGSGLPKPTVYRMVQSMVDLGYLAQDPGNGYYLRTPALEWLGRNSHHEYLRRQARPVMKALLQQFNETVVLSTLQGQDVHFLLVIETTRQLRRIPSADCKEPHYATALGRAMAAYLSDEERKQLLDETELEPLTPRTVRGKRRLAQLLDEVKAQGWCYQCEERELGVCGVAVPILDAGRPVAALGLIVPRIRLTRQKRQSMIEALKAVQLFR